MRLIINMMVVLVIGLTLGGLSASYLIQRAHGLGAINAGPWSAWPFVGGVEIDPYTAAQTTANGTIPLGAAEGLSFEAVSDSSGKDLQQNCNYTLSGNTSISRLWTLSAYDISGQLLFLENNIKSAIFSGDIIRYPDGSFNVQLSQTPRAGNWIPLLSDKKFKLVLRLYDTPITSNSGLIEPIMPEINLIGCDS